MFGGGIGTLGGPVETTERSGFACSCEFFRFRRVAGVCGFGNLSFN